MNTGGDLTPCAQLKTTDQHERGVPEQSSSKFASVEARKPGQIAVMSRIRLARHARIFLEACMKIADCLLVPCKSSSEKAYPTGFYFHQDQYVGT